MALRQRARNEEDKQARAEAILTEAGRLLGPHPYAKITMAQVAGACGLAKGTLYLYFRSKEELFLALLEREFEAWFDSLENQLRAVPTITAESFGARFAASLAERRTLGQLLLILHTILEQNVDPDRALVFKSMVRDRLARGGTTLETRFQALPEGAGPRVLLRIYAVTIGIHQVAHPAPAVADVLARRDMEALRLDFEQDLAASVAALLRGTR